MAARTPRAISNDAFHQIKADYPERSFARALNEGKITERDVTLIRSFIAELQSSRSTSTKRAYKITYTLVSAGDVSSARSRKNDMAALYAGIAALKSGRSKRGREFMKNTITDHMIILKQFYLWLIENEYVTIPEKKLKALKTPHHETMTKVVSDLLMTEEITTMVGACTRSRNRVTITSYSDDAIRTNVETWADTVAALA